jgi:hypothetical protein
MVNNKILNISLTFSQERKHNVKQLKPLPGLGENRGRKTRGFSTFNPPRVVLFHPKGSTCIPVLILSAKCLLNIAIPTMLFIE